ncbi:hypothetical protein QTP88_023372 [Uroleucon formosanum]
MPNLGGPSQSKRALLGTVANSKMLYASPTWAVRGTKTAKNRAELARGQTTVALRITRTYRTVSADASSVLASMLPADVLATERARVRVRLDDQTDIVPSTVKNQDYLCLIILKYNWKIISSDRFDKQNATGQPDPNSSTVTITPCSPFKSFSSWPL